MYGSVNRLPRIAAAATVLSLAAATPAIARHSDRSRPAKPVRVQGFITAIAEDDSSFVVDANGTGKTVNLGAKTRYSAPMRLVRNAADLREGDWVMTISRGATAQRVMVRLLAVEGTASAVTPAADGADGSLTIDPITDANKIADAFLADALAVDVALTDATRYDDDVEPVAGDEVEVLARVVDGAPTSLEAVAVEVEAVEETEPTV